jgi:predicted membrane channel-forming protein YqfA (hemolysin III family)
LQIKNSEGAGLEPLLVVLFPVFEVIVVLGGLGLFWYLFSSPEADKLAGWIYTVVGMLVVFFAPLLFFLPVPMTFYALVQFVAPGSFLIQAGALLGVGGALSLMLKKGDSAESDS